MKILNQQRTRDRLGKSINLAMVISNLGTLQLIKLIETKLPPNKDFYVEFINEYKSGEKMYHVLLPYNLELK